MSNQPERLSGETIAVLDNGEASRRETEQRFRLAAEAAREAIWDWDLCKDLVWRSEGFQTLFGYAADEVSTDFDWWAARIHPHDLEKICCHVPPRTASGAPRNEMQYRFRRSDGTYADVADRWLVIRGPDRRAVRVVGSIADISERRHAEHLAHLRHVEQGHIARANTVGEMAKGLAHELNQPLTAIANYAESCAQVILTGAPGREEKLLLWIEKIVVNSQRAGQMIHRLRGYAKGSDPMRKTVAISELVQDAIDLLAAESRLRNIRVCWEPGRAAAAHVDRGQIQQVLVTLLRNAFDAMSGKRPDERQVTIRSAEHENRIELSIEDRGVGILPENLERVFDAFFTTKPSGVGIGLAVSRSIIEGHGGRLWVTPNPRQGVTLRFTLPMTGVNHV